MLACKSMCMTRCWRETTPNQRMCDSYGEVSGLEGEREAGHAPSDGGSRVKLGAHSFGPSKELVMLLVHSLVVLFRAHVTTKMSHG